MCESIFSGTSLKLDCVVTECLEDCAETSGFGVCLSICVGEGRTGKASGFAPTMFHSEKKWLLWISLSPQVKHKDLFCFTVHLEGTSLKTIMRSFGLSYK